MGDKGKLKCLVKADWAAESSLMQARTNNLLKFPVKLVRYDFVLNMSGLEKVVFFHEPQRAFR